MERQQEVPPAQETSHEVRAVGPTGLTSNTVLERHIQPGSQLPEEPTAYQKAHHERQLTMGD